MHATKSCAISSLHRQADAATRSAHLRHAPKAFRRMISAALLMISGFATYAFLEAAASGAQSAVSRIFEAAMRSAPPSIPHSLTRRETFRGFTHWLQVTNTP